MDTINKKQITHRNLFMKILKEKCPNCGKGDVFKKKKTFLELPVMKDDSSQDIRLWAGCLHDGLNHWIYDSPKHI